MENTGKLAGSTSKMKSIIAYDLSLLPENTSLEQVIEKYNKENVLIYDTSKANLVSQQSIAPYILKIEDGGI